MASVPACSHMDGLGGNVMEQFSKIFQGTYHGLGVSFISYS